MTSTRQHIGLGMLVGALTLAFVWPTIGSAEEFLPPGVTAAAPHSLPDWSHSIEISTPTPAWEMRSRRSYLIPAGEILAYSFFLNLYDRNFTEPTKDYRSNGDTIHTHLTDSRWVFDRDQFSVNQFLHPYGGTIYFGLARSAGLNFWESLLYAGAGSFIWEIAGETTSPSINDQITTTFGGAFLGEPLFRIANLLLENGDNGMPGLWRELAATVISPPTGFNRLMFGNRFAEVYPSHKPATFMRLQVGSTFNFGSDTVADSLRGWGAIGDLTIAYGLPGKPGYSYSRPFDYFDARISSTTVNTIQSIEMRGLLIGATYASQDSTRGIWGLYGSYDYLAPQAFRISTTALSLGTTWQTSFLNDMALQGTWLGGVGYGAAGSVRRADERDYHYGVTPQTLLALRLILGDRVMFDVTGREYYVTGLLSENPQGRENILRGEGGLTVRIFDRHGLSVRYAVSHREAHYPQASSRDQTVSSVSLMYVLLGDSGFGAVDWH